MEFKRARIYCLLATVLFAQLLACSAKDPDPVIEPPARQYVARGNVLANGLAACGFCHGRQPSPKSPLSGGRPQYDNHGEALAPNITFSDTGLRNWNSLQFVNLFRTRINPEGDRISFPLHNGFEWMSEADVLSLYAYLKTLPPVDNEVDKRSLGFISRNTTGIWDSTAVVAGYVPDIDKTYVAEYGEYLADNVARCASCHNTPSTMFGSEKYWSGGAVIRNEFGEKIAPNITSSKTHGIGLWSEDDVVRYLKGGNAPGNTRSDPNFCPVGFFKNAAPEDLITLAKYIKAVPPVDEK